MPKGQHTEYETFWKRNDAKLERLLASGNTARAAGVAIFGDTCSVGVATTKACRRAAKLGFDTSRKLKPKPEPKPVFWTTERIEELRVYYFDEDHTTQECMDHFGNTSIQNIFKRQGWQFRKGGEANRVRYARRFKETGRKREAWLIYFNRVRHCSNVMYTRYARIIDPKGLRSRAHHLDHEFPIARMFDENPDLWYLVAHPANLRILIAHRNLSKRHHAHMSISRLQRRVRQWNRLYGKISLQEFFGVRDIFDCHLPSTWWRR